MEKQKSTQKLIDSLKPQEKFYSVRDGELTGFGVRVSPSGGKTYFVQAQVRGRRKWNSLGSTTKLTEAKARALALRSIAKQSDPQTAGA